VAAIAAALALVASLVPPAGSAPMHARHRKHAGGRAATAHRIAPRAGARGPEALGPPYLDPRDGAVHWPARADFLLSADDQRILGELRASRSAWDSIAVWLGAGERDSLLAPYARLEAARIALVARDSAEAGTLLERAMARSSPWQWAARRQRARLVLAHDGPAAADSILLRAPTDDMDGVEEQELVEDRFDLLLRCGDTTRALDIARQSIGRQVFFGISDVRPGSSGNAVRLEKRLESVLRARGERAGWGDEMGTAEAELALGDRAAGLAQLERASRDAPPEIRWRPALRRARVLRGSRDYARARGALDLADSMTPDSAAKASVWIERAQVEMDARNWPEAEHMLGELAAWPDSLVGNLGVGILEARTLEAQGEWARARDAYAGAASRPPRLISLNSIPHAQAWVPLAAFRAGLMALATGQADSALVWFERSDWYGSFWRAVLLRRSDRAVGDSLLAEIANRPGYTFYQLAARETLGLHGWPGDGVESPPRDSSEMRVASLLYSLGREAEGRALIPRWDNWARRQRLSQPEIGDFYPVARELLRGAALAYSSKSDAYAILLSESAIGLADSTSPAVPWRFVPWAYPPAYERAFASLPDSTAGEGIDRALLRAVARKESHFDAGARSPSNAIGLLQLKLGTAADEARRLRLGRPGERDLFDPRRNVRLGSAYLAHLLARFGSVQRALAAYNAGPAALARWLELWEKTPGRDLGGAALECELTCRPETEKYVKEILAARQAYRELRPTTEP
jgi:soluble lytic murein transglycosylase-like protein